MKHDRNQLDGPKAPDGLRENEMRLLTEDLASLSARASKYVGLSLKRFSPHE